MAPRARVLQRDRPDKLSSYVHKRTQTAKQRLRAAPSWGPIDCALRSGASGRREVGRRWATVQIQHSARLSWCAAPPGRPRHWLWL